MGSVQLFVCSSTVRRLAAAELTVSSGPPPSTPIHSNHLLQPTIISLNVALWFCFGPFMKAAWIDASVAQRSRMESLRIGSLR